MTEECHETLLQVFQLKLYTAYLYLKYFISNNIFQLLNTVTYNHKFQSFGQVDHY